MRVDTVFRCSTLHGHIFKQSNTHAHAQRETHTYTHKQHRRSMTRTTFLLPPLRTVTHSVRKPTRIERRSRKPRRPSLYCRAALQLMQPQPQVIFRKQHTATHCNTLQHTATHCNTLQHTAIHCNTLQHTATHRTFRTALQLMQQQRPVIFSKATHGNTLQHTATHCNTLQHTATHCNTLQHTAPSEQRCSRCSRSRRYFFSKSHRYSDL